MTAALVVGVAIGLLLTPDGRAWLRHPTLMLGSTANASAAPQAPEDMPEDEVVQAPVVRSAAAPAAAGPAPAVTPLDRRAAARGLRIGVFGDSMADGLWTGLYRELRDRPDVSVIKFSEVSTGLSRYDYVDIQAKTARQLSEQPVDVAVVLFGTNDAQAISIDGRIHAFGSDGWKAAYARRVTDLVTLLRSRDVAVYWVGLPRMKRETFDGRMALINAVVQERMTALGVPWLETAGLTSNAEGRYEAYLNGPDGRRRLMRADDGIHMSMAGYLRLTEPVAARIRADAGLDRPTEAAPASGG